MVLPIISPIIRDIEVVEIVYQDQVDDMTAAMQAVLDKYPQLDGAFLR